MSRNIGIVVAMERETGVLKKFSTKKEMVAGFSFYKFKAGGNNVVLAECGIGEMRSAAACAILLSRYGVDSILNYGYVGALDEEMQMNSVYAVDRIVATDVDLVAFGLQRGQLDGFENVELFTNVALTQEVCGALPRRKLASSEKFVSSADAKRRLRSEFGAQLCDMEGAGIAAVCQQAKIPFASIKIVADGLEEDCTDTFETNSVNGIQPLVELICRYLKKAK